ncbi:MAG TPA: hypothetical protein VFK05_19330 [Polyangiaceae bacterium]|nr:hypothetical protein [Polyangiaceae bacterium]
MNLERLSVLAIVMIAVSAFVRSALGEPEGALPRANEAQASGRADDAVVYPKLDPQLWARLNELQSARHAARKQALTDPKRWDDERAQRASAHRAQLSALWGNLVGRIDGQARLRIHADRMARLNRLLYLAEQKTVGAGQQPDLALVQRVQADISRELTRHVQAMQELRAAGGVR